MAPSNSTDSDPERDEERTSAEMYVALPDEEEFDAVVEMLRRGFRQVGYPVVCSIQFAEYEAYVETFPQDKPGIDEMLHGEAPTPPPSEDESER